MAKGEERQRVRLEMRPAADERPGGRPFGNYRPWLRTFLGETLAGIPNYTISFAGRGVNGRILHMTRQQRVQKTDARSGKVPVVRKVYAGDDY